MDYRPLGRTGLHASVLTLGTMMFGAWGNPDEAACTRMVHAALDAGVNVVDTADVYDFGRSEEIVGKALRGRRDAVVLATKVNNAMDGVPGHRGNARRWITAEVEHSLTRLGTDRIDLYQVHRPDPETGIDETLACLSDLVHQGKVRAIGTSTFPPGALMEAAWAATRGGHERFATEQPPYSVLTREVEREVLPVAQRLSLGVLVWAPLNGGWLSGQYRDGEPPPTGSRAVREPDHFDWEGSAAAAKLRAVAELRGLAAESGLSLPQLALGFVLSHPAVTTAIIGPRTEEQLRALLRRSVAPLAGDVLDRIDEIVRPGLSLNPSDGGFVPPALADARLRRR